MLLMTLTAPLAHADELTVEEDNATSTYFPIYGFYADQNSKATMIYPASDLGDMIDGEITGISFSYSTAEKPLTTGILEVYVGEVESTTLSSHPTGLTKVYSGTPNISTTSGGTFVISFNQGAYIYKGGNLAVQVIVAGGTDGRITFLGKRQDSTTSYLTYGNYGSSITGSDAKYLPMATFSYDAATSEPTIKVNNSSLDFNAFTGSTAENTVIVSGRNLTGDITATIVGEGFSVNATTIAAADAANGAELTITYAPTAAGTHTGTLTLSSDGAQDVVVDLAGTAVAPVISGTVTPAELTFETYENVAATGAITIENTGNTAFTPVFSGIEAPFSIAEATEIAAGQSKEFTVTYAPEEIGSHTGTLNVTIGEQTPIAVTLTGAATEAPLVVTVAENGTSNSTHIPITGNYFDNANDFGQTIYNKNDLGLLANKNITKVKYYSNDAIQAKLAGIELEIYLMETPLDEIEFDGNSFRYVPFEFTGSPNGTYTITGNEGKELEFDLSTPFAYSGNNNLVVQLKVKTKGSYQNIPWVGKTSDKTIGYYAYSTSTTGHESFLPKTTFTYEKEEEPAAVEATLAQIEGAEGVVGTKYAITDEYLVAVEKRDVEIDGTGYVYVWCKDNDNVTDRLAAAEGVIDFMQQQGVQGTWDQSNWVVLRFKGDDQEARSLKNCKLTNVIGTYVDASNYMIDVESYEKGGNAEYTPNVYCVANFNAANWGAAGVQQEGKDSDAPYYFFMTPKAQEVCKVTFAEWNGTAFTVPAASGFAQNTLTLGWTYNQNSDGTPMSQEAVVANLDEGTSYQFNAIVTRSSSKGAISGGSVVYPTNLVGGEDDEVPTAISTVGVNGMVESVKYYNVAGVESNVPFEGINIVVTRYSDGFTTTTKVLK